MEWLVVGFIIGWIANGFARAMYERYQETRESKGLYQFPAQEKVEGETSDHPSVRGSQ